jgi:hypothetical protein
VQNADAVEAVIERIGHDSTRAGDHPDKNRSGQQAQFGVRIMAIDGEPWEYGENERDDRDARSNEVAHSDAGDASNPDGRR